MCVEFVVNVFTKVGGELLQAFTQCDVFLMKRSLRDEEVVLGDVVAFTILLLKEWVCLRRRHIHHVKVMSRKMREQNQIKLPFPKIVDVTSTIPRDTIIGELVPGIVSHTYK